MTAIDDKYTELGGPGGSLGKAKDPETETPDGAGRFRTYETGVIYWTAETGAHPVRGQILNRWRALGRETSRLGYPTSEETKTPHGEGRVSHFQNGSIYWEPKRGAYEVYSPPPPPVCDPQLQGEWRIPPYDSGVVGTHAVLLHTNQVLFFSYLDPGAHVHEAPQNHGDSRVLDLKTRQMTKPTPTPEDLNLFCGGQALLADGRVLVAGGEREHKGVRSLHVFKPKGSSGGAWQYLGDMADGRWYPTCVTLPDGRIFILGGAAWMSATEIRRNMTYEVFDPGAGLQAPRPAPILTEVGNFVTYPFVFVLPSRKLFIHAGTRTGFLDLSTWELDDARLEAVQRPRRHGRTYPVQGSCVLLPLLPAADPPYRARVMTIGGGGADPVSIRDRATRTCEILDTNAPSPAWMRAAPMENTRVMPDAVLLPDGKVLVVNGSRTGYADNAANPVYEAELYDPDSDTWTTLCRMTVPRLYHATALLLPDGRVMTAGTDSMWNPDPFRQAQLRLEIFSPPYLFRGPRPVIAKKPKKISHGKVFGIRTPDASSIASVALLRCGSGTHSFNSDQRYVGLEIRKREAERLRVKAPPDGFVAPPGHYMLFLVNNDGVPSLARFIHLD